MTIHDVMQNISDDQARYYLKKYYGLLKPEADKAKKKPYTGAYFESIDRDFWEDNPNRITGSDLYALTTLQISVPRDAGIGRLTNERQNIKKLLEKIPDNKLQELSSADFERYLGEDSPARKLWDLLCRNATGDPKWGIGPTTASKIMARKRPNLIPIQDSVVDDVIGRNKSDAWRLWWQSLTDRPALAERAARIRQVVQESDQPYPELSTLRTLDIVLWMFGKDQQS